MSERLGELPGARELLPFVQMFYAHPSVYVFATEDGVVHEIRQGQGGEQGDGLMPALFSLGMDRAMLYKCTNDCMTGCPTVCAFVCTAGCTTGGIVRGTAAASADCAFCPSVLAVAVF